MQLRFFLLAVLCSSGYAETEVKDHYTDLLSTLISKVDKIQSSVEESKVLDRDYREKTRDRLADISKKVDDMQSRIETIEKQSAGTKNLASLETKLEQFGKKLVDQQNVIKTEAREVVALTKSFKGSLEEGIKKMINTINYKNKKRGGGGEEDEADEIIGAIEEMYKGVDNCTKSSSQTKQRLDEVYDNLLQEWTTAHRQMREFDLKLNKMNVTPAWETQIREIDRKLSRIGNSSGSETDWEDVRLVGDRIRQDYNRLEELEPKIIHAIRISREIGNFEFEGDDGKSAKVLTTNLNVTLESLLAFLESNLKSVREGTEIIEEFLVNPQAARESSKTYLSEKAVEEIYARLDRNLNTRIMSIGDQFRTFLSTEGQNSLGALREELRASAFLIKKEHETQNTWRAALQEGVTRLQHVISNATEEIKKCMGTTTTDSLNHDSFEKDSIKQDLARMLRNSLG